MTYVVIYDSRWHHMHHTTYVFMCASQGHVVLQRFRWLYRSYDATGMYR